MYRTRRKALKVLEFVKRQYVIDPLSRASWDLGEIEYELVDLDVVQYALRHMRLRDRLNPVRVGLAVLESWQILYEQSPAFDGVCEIQDDDFEFRFM